MSPQTLSPELQETPVVNAENPWPGLAPFDEAQADFFYGREREVEDLFRRLRLNLLSVLYGQSGLGKTSLVRAALFPRLRGAGMLPVPIRLDYSDESPPARTQIWQALAAALQHASQPAPPLSEDQTLWEYFHQRSLELSVTPVLVFDQFEEIFTLGPERAGGSGFVRDCLGELAALIENRPPDRVEARFDREPKLVAQFDFDRRDYRVLVSLREDYLAHLHDLSGKIPSITLNNMRLTPLDGSRALEAVERPGGKLVAPGAAEAIVRVVAGAREERAGRRVGALGITDEHEQQVEQTPLESLTVDPSLLSLLCRELNQKRRDERMPAITPELVEANRENILNNFYERCLAGLPDGVQVFVEEDLLTETGFRETLNVDNAESKLRQHGADPRALTVLVNRRLLHYEQRGMSTRVELTHDVLAPVVRQSRTLRREREAIQEGEARKRSELEESERAAQQARAEAEAKYERSKQQRRVFAGIGLAMAAVAAIAVYLGIQARAQSKEARAQRDRANALVKQVETQNANLQQQQKALSDTTLVATLARDTAHQMLATAVRERAKSDSLLTDFCSYGLTVINRFGDSTAGNIGLTRAYNSLVQLSDASVERMIRRSPTDACPRQLDARTEGVSAGLLVALGDTANARRQGQRAILAARYLTRYPDSLSRRVLNQTYHSLAADLFNARDDAAVLQVAREGLPFAKQINPQTDSLAFDWQAWLYDYGAFALFRLHRMQEAKAWADSGLVVVAQGKRRADQSQHMLLSMESYLQLHRGAIALDSAVHDSATVRNADSAAVAAARARFKLINTVGSLEELAKMEGFQADDARKLGRYSEAVRAADSSVSHWGAILRQGRNTADTTMIVDGLTGMVQGAGKASLALQRLGQKDAAVALARATVDSARTLVQVRATLGNQGMLTTALQTFGFRLESVGNLLAADSSFHAAVRIDSLLLERASSSYASAISADMEDYLDDVSRILTKRLQADTTGQDSSSQNALLRRAEERRRGARETLVWLRRRSLRRLNTQAARDSLASALNNVAWTYLLIDRPEQAAEAAREGLSLSTAESYLPPNYFNAELLSGHDEEAQTIFRRFAATMVERPPVPFPCAALRDIRELARRGIALPRHVSVVEGLVAAQHTPCQNPTNSPTP